MKFILACLVTLFFCTSNYSQQVAGTIFFTDGSSIKFTAITSLCGNFDDEQVLPRVYEYSIKVYYENALRDLPFKKIRIIEIINWEKAVGKSYEQGIKAKIKVETITGVVVEHYCGFLWTIGVKILDKLTGEVKIQNYLFLDKNNSRLNISKLVFNN